MEHPRYHLHIKNIGVNTQKMEWLFTSRSDKRITVKTTAVSEIATPGLKLALKSTFSTSGRPYTKFNIEVPRLTRTKSYPLEFEIILSPVISILRTAL